ncbi:hypothetical protein VAE122_2960584 [Vibrio aestuarianus]|nr:hypothetical protein VAE122_2960584 [Vibrio aestuarianus]CAH8214219.1 hypothetical protein VAEKB19_3900003 [Vibrio aestuarianus]
MASLSVHPQAFRLLTEGRIEWSQILSSIGKEMLRLTDEQFP